MTPHFSLTDKAVNRLLELISTEPKKQNLRLRISISGGGCSGFQYHFTLDHHQDEDDLVFGSHNAEVVIDKISLGLLDGSVLDYTEDMASSTFVIRNPNVTASCGCGNSFSV